METLAIERGIMQLGRLLRPPLLGLQQQCLHLQYHYRLLRPSVSSPGTHTFAPTFRHSVAHSGSSMSLQRATTQLPPVIPPLSFKNAAANERTGLGAQGGIS